MNNTLIKILIFFSTVATVTIAKGCPTCLGKAHNQDTPFFINYLSTKQTQTDTQTTANTTKNKTPKLAHQLKKNRRNS